MKRIISLIIALIVLVSSQLVSYAYRNGDVIGKVLNTDIVAYINHYAIPSFAVNGTSCVVAEDLRNFGFNVIWDASNRTLNINRNTSINVAEMSFTKDGVTGSKYCNLLYTDITVYANGQRIPSYAINGYTFIPMESLNMFGMISWVSNERALKMWVDGLHIRNVKQPIQTANKNGFKVGTWSAYVQGHTQGMSGTRIIKIASIDGNNIKMALGCNGDLGNYRWYSISNNEVVFDLYYDDLDIGSLAHNADAECVKITPEGSSLKVTFYFVERGTGYRFSGSQVFLKN